MCVCVVILHYHKSTCADDQYVKAGADTVYRNYVHVYSHMFNPHRLLLYIHIQCILHKCIYQVCVSFCRHGVSRLVTV